MCEKRVKTCEMSVKIGHFSHVFHMVFHIHTPSSVGSSCFTECTLMNHDSYNSISCENEIINMSRAWDKEKI